MESSHFNFKPDIDKPTMPPVVTYTKGLWFGVTWQQICVSLFIVGIVPLLIVGAVITIADDFFGYELNMGVKAMSEEKAATEEVKSSDGVWVMTVPEHAPPEATEEARKIVGDLALGKGDAVVLREGWKLEHMQANGPYFTWDGQTIPPTREYHPEHDGPYPVVQVHNSHSPGLKKQGRLIRPVTKPDAVYPIWLVDIEGEEVTVHDPEEAWQ